MAADVHCRCPHCDGPGPFYHRIEVLTRIEIVFTKNGSHRIVPDAEAEEIRASEEGYECGACGGTFPRPITDRSPARERLVLRVSV